MSYADCIDSVVKAGKLPRDVGERLKAADDFDAEVDNVVNEMTQKKRETALQAVKQAEAWANIQAYDGKKSSGLIALMTKDPAGKAKYDNVDYMARVYAGEFEAYFAEALSAFRTRTIGFTQDKKRLEQLIRAIYGEAVDDDEVVKYAKQWAVLTEHMRKTTNAKGGKISKNEKWLLPQNHDAKAIEKLGKDVWKEKITPMLDRNQMRDDFGNVLSDEQFDSALDFVYETITTGGLNKVKDFTAPRMGKKLSSRGSERRFLYFKDAESWMAYNKQFGKGDIFTTLTDHIQTRAHDIALMDVMGPNPDDTYAALKAMVEREEKISQSKSALSDAVFRVVSGKTSEGELTTLADFMQSKRNILTASTLASAFLSSISDVGLSTLTAKFNGFSAFKTLSRQMSLMNPANEADRIFAVKLGLTAESWTNMAHAANRYSDVAGVGPTARVAEGVMRASLLQPWTDAGRKAFGMEFAGMLADHFDTALGNLDKNVRRAFDTYGITEADWNLFRKQKPLEHKGAKFADMTAEGGQKFHRMVLSETDFAIPSPDARVRAITTGGTGRGTVAGQAWRAAMMLKSFPITILTTHIIRGAALQGWDRVGYLGALMASTTVLGGVALQAKDVAAGREPRPIDGDFAKAAIAQGGGIGILGDFIFSDVNRFGGGPVETFFGPTGELASRTLKLTWGNIQEAAKGEETNVLGEAAQYVKRYTPDTWQIRLLLDGFLDSATMLADPKHKARLRRQMRRRQKEYDQGYWWKKGEILPEFAQ